jgi:hypothetical protein
VIQEAIDRVKQCTLSSSFLGTLDQNYTLIYSTKADIDRNVVTYMKDLVKGLGINGVYVSQGIQVTQLRPDIWLLLTNGTPFLVLEVKKPQVGIANHPKVISQLSGYMRMLREYHGVGHVFGIVASIDEWRVYWLADCDEIARSDQIVNDEFNPTQFGTNDSLHGTEVLSGSSVHPIVATTIWKAYFGIKNCKTIVKPLLNRCVIRVDGSSQAWEDLNKLKINHLSMDAPHGNCKTFFLLIDLKQGLQGRIWLAISNAAEKYCLVALKFSKSKRKDQKDQEGSNSSTNDLSAEAQFWKAMGYSSQFLHENKDNELLCMPFGITCSEDGNGWDTTIWDQIKSCLPKDIQKRFEDALVKTTPEEALETAVNLLKRNKIWHQDLQWRHLALLPKVKIGWFSNYPMTVEPSFIDYGIAKKINRSNAEEAETDMDKNVAKLKNELIKKCRHKRQKTDHENIL